MSDLPPIRQQIIVDADTRGANQSLGDTQKSLKELGKAWDEQNESFDDFVKRQAEYRVRSSEVRKAINEQEKALRLARGEVDKSARSHGLLSRALQRDGDDHKRLSKDVHSLASGMKIAGAAASLFATTVAFIKWPAMVAGANLATSAIGALGSAVLGLVAALGPMLNLVGLIPAALTALGGGLGAVLIGSRGVIEAIGGGFAPKTGGGGAKKDPVDEARKVEDAVRGVARAQETLSDSQREVSRAQEDLNKAWLDARNNLRDLREEQTRGTNSVERAEISLARAKERQAELAEDDEATALDRRDALLDISDAELDLLDAQQKRTQNARDLAEAESKGIAGSDAVTDATERLDDSQQSVIDNTLELKRAIEDVGRSLKSDAGAGAVDKFADAMAKLGPEAREFVNSIVGNKSVFTSIKRDVQESLFAPINEGMKGVIANAPAFKSFLTDSASGVGQIGKAVATFFGTEGFAADLRTLGAGNKGIFTSLADGATDLLRIFTDLAVVGQPFIKEIVDLAVGGLGRFADKIAEMRANGGLEDAFRRGMDVAKQFGRILSDAVGLIGDVLKAAKPLGDDLLDSLEDIMDRAHDFTSSFAGQNRMRDFFDSMRPVLHESALFLRDISKHFIELAETNATPLANVISRLRTEVLPIIRELLDAVGPKFMDALIDLATSFGRVVTALFGESSPMLIFLDALTGVFDVIQAILDAWPPLKEILVALITFATVWKSLKLTSSLLGLTTVKDSFKSLRGILFGKAAAEGAEGAASAGLAGGVKAFSVMVGGLGPAAIIVGTLAVIAGGLYLGFMQATKHAREFKKTLEGFKGAFKDALEDPARTLESTLFEAINKRLGDRDQLDDLGRAEIGVKDLTTAVINGGNAMEDVRRKAVESGEVTFQILGPHNQEMIKEAERIWIEHGKTIKGVFVNDLGKTFEDYEKAAQDAAQEVINVGRVNGTITPELHGAAIEYDLQNQGLLDFIANGPNYVTQAGFIDQKNKDIAEGLERQERARRALADLARDPHAVRDATTARGEAGAAAISAAGAVGTAEEDLAKARARGDPEAIAEAEDNLTQARKDAEEAAKNYGDAENDLQEAQARRRGEDVTDRQLLEGRQSAYDRLAAFIKPGAPFRNDLDSLIAEVDVAFADTIFSIDVSTTPEADAWMTMLKETAGFTVRLPAAPVSRGATANTTATSQRPPALLPGKFTDKPGGKGGGTWHYVAGATDPTRRPDPQPLPGGGFAPQRYNGTIGYWEQYYAQGGILGRVGSGFMTGGPTAIVGEGKRQFPEYVIPSDPEHRGNAWRLLVDLLQHIGTPTMQGGGTLADFSGIRAMAGAIATGSGGEHYVTTATTIQGDTIGTSIGNEWVFNEGAIVVSDWDAAKEQMERDQRLRNMTSARGARSNR